MKNTNYDKEYNREAANRDNQSDNSRNAPSNRDINNENDPRKSGHEPQKDRDQSRSNKC